MSFVLDMEWYKGEITEEDDNMEVDIGYLPQMELLQMPTEFFSSPSDDL